MKIKLFLLLLSCAYAQVSPPEDATLDFKELAEKYGQEAEELDIITDDGYILKLFHILGDKTRPVLYVHGLLDSSDSFIVRGNLSLAVNLARNNVDVWAINLRGNRYSRKHKTLDPDKDPAFWNFYVHDFGTKDLPAAIDFITEKTDSNITVIGYSEGTTSTLVLGAARPEYNDKMNLFIALAPICFLEHVGWYPSTMIRLGPNINRGLKRSGTQEVLNYKSPLKAIMDTFCNIEGAGYLLCVQGTIFQLAGANPKQFEPDFLPIWLGHYPNGSSRKNLYHLVQMGTRNKFAYYDYGAKKNMLKYGTEDPPEYDLSKVTMKVALLVGINDPVSTIQDVDRLRERLPKVVEFMVMEDPSFNHIDFLWGKTTYTLVLPKVLELLDTYG